MEEIPNQSKMERGSHGLRRNAGFDGGFNGNKFFVFQNGRHGKNLNARESLRQISNPQTRNKRTRIDADYFSAQNHGMGTLKQKNRADAKKTPKKVCGERVSYTLARKKKAKRELQHSNGVQRSSGNGILHDDTTAYRTRFDSDIQPLLFPTQAEAENSFKDFSRAIRVELGQNWQGSFGVGLRVWAHGALPRPIRTLSLFSGAGGLDIGFHDAGFEIVEQVEIEEKFVATLRANSGHGKYLSESKVKSTDIRDFHPPDDMRVDFIIGDPPCQTFSAAGRRAAGVQGSKL